MQKFLEIGVRLFRQCGNTVLLKRGKTIIMISQKLKTIFYISIPVFIAHGLEEIFNGFYNVDWFFKLTFRFLETMSIPQATFIVFQIMIWLAFIVFAFLIASE